jgi:hypothetical protein
MTPVEIIPEDERDPEAVIRDAETIMEQARVAYEQAREYWLELNAKAGHPVDERPARWN